MGVMTESVMEVAVTNELSPQLKNNLKIPDGPLDDFTRAAIDLGVTNLGKMVAGEPLKPNELALTRETVVGLQVADTQRYFTENLAKVANSLKTTNEPLNVDDTAWQNNWENRSPSVVALQKVNIEGNPYMVISDGSLTEGLTSEESTALLEGLTGKRLADLSQQLKHSPLNHYPASIIVEIPGTNAKLILQEDANAKRGSDKPVNVRMIVDNDTGHQIVQGAINDFKKSLANS